MATKDVEELKFTATESDAIYLADRYVAAIRIPDDDAFVNKSLSIKAGVEINEFKDVYNDSGEKLIIPISKNRHIWLDLEYLAGANYIKIIANESLEGKSIQIVTKRV